MSNTDIQSGSGSTTSADGAGSLGQRVRSLRIGHEPAVRSRGTSWPAWLLCLVFATVAGWLGYREFLSSAAKETDAKAAEANEPQAAAPVATAPSSERPAAPGSVVLESKGYIIPVHQILVSPQVSGRLLKLMVLEGKTVAKGDVLGEIERTEYEADYERAVANVERAKQHLLEMENGNLPEEIGQAQKELEESQAQLKQYKSDLDRSTDLLRSNSVTRQEHETAESAYRVTSRKVERLQYRLELLKKGPRAEQIAVSRADVRQYEADVVKARWRLENCTIRAPISGTILKKAAEEGNIVNPMVFNGSFSLCEMADLSELEVDLSIQERDVARVFTRQRCRIRSDAFPERVSDGYVSRLMPTADRAKGAIPVRVRVIVPKAEEGVYLKPEMGVIVTFLKEEYQDNPEAGQVGPAETSAASELSQTKPPTQPSE